jgi:hypothetical protein
MSYGCQKLDRWTESGILGRLHLSAQIRFLAKFLHDFPRNFVYKKAIKELSFSLVTHIAYFNTRFGRYRFLNSAYSADQILDRLDIQVLGQVLKSQEARNLPGFEHRF